MATVYMRKQPSYFYEKTENRSIISSDTYPTSPDCFSLTKTPALSESISAAAPYVLSGSFSGTPLAFSHTVPESPY